MKRKHKLGRNGGRNQKRGLERFITSRLFIVLGSVFLLIGLYYSFSSGGTNSLSGMLMDLLRPSDSVHVQEAVGNGLTILLFCFMPAGLALIVSGFYAKKFSSVTYPASLIIALYLIVIQTKVLVINFNYGGSYYPSFFIASLFLFLPVLLFFTNAFCHRKPAILILACLYFYISVVLYAANYSGRFDYLFPFVLIFSMVIAWVSQRIESPYINLINFFFAIGFFGLFWLRKFVVSSKPDFLIEFYVFSVLFYLLFYLLVVYASNAKEHPLNNWFQSIIICSNLLFFLGTTSFVIFKYYSFGFLWIFVLGLLLANLYGLKLLKQYHVITWTQPHHLNCMLLAASILPLWLHQNMVLLFTACLTIFMLVYANAFKGKISMCISLVSMLMMLCFFIFSWMIDYMPAVLAERILPESDLMWKGVIACTVMMITLRTTLWLLTKIESPLSKKWFTRSKYNHLVSGLSIFSFFLTLGWIGFSLICWITGSMSQVSVGWFISGSAFFIIMLTYFSKKRSIFKKSLLFFGFLFMLLYPLMVHWNMLNTRDELIQLGLLNWYSLGLHYIALFSLGLMGFMIIRRLYIRYIKNIVISRGLQFLSFILLLFIFSTEYDNCTLLVSTLQNINLGRYGGEGSLLTYNQHLPYSAIFWLLSSGLFVWGVLQHDKFIRNSAIVIFTLVLVKIFVFDFEILDQMTRSIVLIFIGLFLIGLAMVYPYLLKANLKIDERVNRNSHREHHLTSGIELKNE